MHNMRERLGGGSCKSCRRSPTRGGPSSARHSPSSLEQADADVCELGQSGLRILLQLRVCPARYAADGTQHGRGEPQVRREHLALGDWHLDLRGEPRLDERCQAGVRAHELVGEGAVGRVVVGLVAGRHGHCHCAPHGRGEEGVSRGRRAEYEGGRQGGGGGEGRGT